MDAISGPVPGYPSKSETLRKGVGTTIKLMPHTPEEAGTAGRQASSLYSQH